MSPRRHIQAQISTPPHARQSAQAGFSLVLTLLILAGMLASSLAISDMVFRVGRSVGNASNSEMAYYAAETAAEKTLFAVNQEYQNIDDWELSVAETPAAAPITAGYRAETINPIISCVVAPLSDPICIPDGSLAIHGSLAPGQSYELDLDIMTDDPYGVKFDLTANPPANLPGAILIDSYSLKPATGYGPAGAPWGEIIKRGSILDPTDPAHLSDTYSTTTEDYFHKIRLVNSGPNNLTYSIYSADDPSISPPILELLIRTRGFFHNTERQLETKLNKWHTYGMPLP